MRTLSPLDRPAAHAEHALVSEILQARYGPGSTLPGERELATQLGVTRPTLREALQRLAREGWITIQQGKPTVVNDYWREGGLGVLATLARLDATEALPADFVLHLLEVRLHLAPAYTRAAVARSADEVSAALAGAAELTEDPAAFARFDWALHHELAAHCGNPVYVLILNGFAGIYQPMAADYFAHPAARAASRRFYADLLAAAQAHDPAAAETLTHHVMQQSIELWQAVQAGG